MISPEIVSNLEKDYNSIEGEQRWPVVYHEIRVQQYDYACKDAKRSENRPLNRYRDVNPYDHTRVRLSRGTVDYINASLVEVPAAERRYILAQGPLPDTTGHFWLMIWEQRTRAIIMLNKTIEKNQIKCHQYWPLGRSGPEDALVLPDVGLTVELVSQTDCSYYTVSALKLTDHETGEHREVLHYHYTTWPDFGIPQSPKAFLSFLSAVREAGVLEPEVGPAVVHCSAGIGRSGTFCLVDSYLLMLERGCVNGQSIQSVLLTMRQYRMGLIQTHEQLKFSYLAIVEGAKSLLKNNSLCDMTNGNSSPSKRKHPADEDDDVEENDDEPPPPPPRTESLNRSPPAPGSYPRDVYNQENLTDSSEEEAPPLPPRRGSSQQREREREPELAVTAGVPPAAAAEPGPAAQRPANLVDAPVMNEGHSELRRRRAQKAQLEQRVDAMRRKQQQHELWQRRRQQLRPLGYTAAALGGLLLAYLIYTRCL